MPFTIPKNNVKTTLGASHTSGSGTLTVAAGDGADFGTVTPATPMRFTVYTSETSFTIFKATGRSGDVLSGLSAIEGTADANYPSGTKVSGFVTAGEITDLQTAMVVVSPESSTDNVIQSTGNFTGLVVKAQAGQTFNLLEIQSSAGTAMASINATGRVFAAGVHGGYNEAAPDPKAIVTNFLMPRDPNLNSFCLFDYQDALAYRDQKGATTFFSPAPNSTTTPDNSGTNTIYRDNEGYCTWGASTSPYPITIESDFTANPIAVKGRAVYSPSLTFRADAYGVLPTNIKIEVWNSSTSSYQTFFDGPPPYNNTTSGNNSCNFPSFTSPGTGGNVYKLKWTFSGTNPLPAGQNFRLQRTILYHTTDPWDSWHVSVGGGDIYSTLNIRTGADTNKGLTIKANSASQSANLLETQTSAGALLTSVNPAGQLLCQTLFVAAAAFTLSSTGSNTTLRFSAQTSTTADMIQAKIMSAWNNSTHATRAADLAVYVSDFATDREVIRLRANGSAALLGFFGVTPVVRQTGGALTAAASYGTNEQTMLQRAYDALRNLGLIT